ncbi:1-aminocyclopropane-1-carboxylate synthase-like protein 1 isoform X2 [Bradysia coprophila]|uniref:1-aminocyclopropane-1-carboxylate synthase-like protein 1 isoform X2 n=1 Tax=Bradysia coprophila TaxID=38358 RepID=UPI00187D7E97|nr:1-aminocyclopropane-1-carboxylate synthase-like protein 1 isoform X2 [Bradysia coprophila]
MRSTPLRLLLLMEEVYIYKTAHNNSRAHYNCGIINFGTAVNGLMDEVWLNRFHEIEPFKVDQSHFRYYQFWGTNDFLQELASFMTKCFKPWKAEISMENLLIFNGALLTLDLLGCLLGDANDVFLCPSPAYPSYFHACVQRWDIEMVTVPLKVVEPSKETDLDVHFELTLEDIEKVFVEECAKGKNVRAFLLNNPQNPLGKVFDRQLVVDIMKFCQRNGLHLIVDEMYALSAFDTETDYNSVLSMNTDDFIQPDMLHVIWGFSKDLCLVSYRTGVLHTRNEPLKLNLKSMAAFQASSVPTMVILRNILKDHEWFHGTFFPENHKKLRQAYSNAKNKFASKGIRTTCSSAGFFFLADFRSFIVPLTDDNCHELVKTFYDNKVYLTPYWEMKAPMGWFRVVFSVYSDDDFQIGFDRVCTSIEQYQQMRNRK